MNDSTTLTTPRSELSTSQTMAALGAISDEFSRRNGFAGYHQELTESTRRAHKADLATFAGFLADFAQATGDNRPDLATGGETPTAEALYGDAVSWSGVTYGMVDLFVEWMKRQGYSIASMGRKLSTLRAYCNKAAELGAMPAEQAAAIRGIKVPSGKRARNLDQNRVESGQRTRIGNKKAGSIFLGPDVLQRLRDNHEDTPVGRRERLLMALLVEFGLRVSEVAGLTVGDVDIAANTIHVYRLKTDLDQKLDMTPAVRAAVLAWFADIDPEDTEAPLLRGSHRGGVLTYKGISTRSVARIVRRLGEENGVKGLSPHDIRHSWTDINMDRVHDLPRGKDTIRQAGGWKTSAMVDRYAKDKEIANEGMGSPLE